MVRASRKYQSRAPITADFSLPTHRLPDHTTYTDHQETIARNAEDIVAGQTAEVPSTAIKRSSITFHDSSPRQELRLDAVEKGRRAPEAGV